MTNGDSHASKRDIERLEQKLDQSAEQLRSEMSHNYNDLVERITGSETRVLKAFYGYAESNQKRMEQLDDNDANLMRRISTLEERLLQVEKRLNFPPSA